MSLHSVLFDVEPFRRDEVTDLTATRASFDVRGFTIDLLSPTGNGPVREALESDGEGPFEVSIVVEDLTMARRAMDAAESTGQDELRPTPWTRPSVHAWCLSAVVTFEAGHFFGVAIPLAFVQYRLKGRAQAEDMATPRNASGT